MNYFIVRVELHEINSWQKPTADDYDQLHAVMQKKHYYRVIESDKGEWYHLPHATYYAYSRNMTRKEILDQVTDIVKTVWSKAGKLVVEGSMTWEGLIPASAQEVKDLTG